MPSSGILKKRTFDALSEKTVRSHIEGIGRPTAVVCGAETHVCVAQTALALLDRGFRTVLATDACGSRFEADRAAGIDRMRQAGVVPTTVEAIAFEWLGNADHPRFREVLSVIKDR